MYGFWYDRTCPKTLLFGHLLAECHTPMQGVPRACQQTLCPVFGQVASRMGIMPHAMPPRKAPNATRRSREYLTPREVDALIAAARRLGRYGHRDATMLLLAYRHGLR